MRFTKILNATFSVVVTTAMLTLTACGGGGDDKKAEGFSGPLPQLSSVQIDQEKIGCFPKLPDMSTFNSYMVDMANQEPLATTYISTSQSEGEGGTTIAEIPMLNQNQEALDNLRGLFMSAKDFGETALRDPNMFKRFMEAASVDGPMMAYVKNKQVYSQIRSYCRDVECLGISIFGETWGVRSYFKYHFGLNLSGYINPNDEDFADTKSLESVLNAIASFPKGTFPIVKERFVREFQPFAENIVISPYATNETLAEGAAALQTTIRRNNGMLVNMDVHFFDSWKQSDDLSKTIIAFHELMHLVDGVKDQNIQLAHTEDWLKLSKWKQNPQSGNWSGNPKVMCSEYGKTNPSEDFAECGVLYRYNPSMLKKISRKKYNFLKNRVFEGVEYTSDRTCQSSQLTFFN